MYELQEQDPLELIDFAKAYRDLGHSVQEQLDTLLDDPSGRAVDELNPNAVDLIDQKLSHLNVSIAEAVAEYRQELVR